MYLATNSNLLLHNKNKLYSMDFVKIPWQPLIIIYYTSVIIFVFASFSYFNQLLIISYHSHWSKLIQNLAKMLLIDPEYNIIHVYECCLIWKRTMPARQIMLCDWLKFQIPSQNQMFDGIVTL